MGNKTITITEEQFAKAIADACVKFDREFEKASDGTSSIPGIIVFQNMMFGLELKKVLFDENKGEE